MTTASGVTSAVPLAPATDPQAAIAALPTDFRNGWRTSEFWVAIATWLLPLLTVVLHKDLSNLAVPLASLAAGLANGAYAISRAITKSSHNALTAATVSAATTSSAASAEPKLDVAAVTTWVSTMAGAVQALTAALNSPQPTSPMGSASPMSPPTSQVATTASVAVPVEG